MVSITQKEILSDFYVRSIVDQYLPVRRCLKMDGKDTKLYRSDKGNDEIRLDACFALSFDLKAVSLLKLLKGPLSRSPLTRL